MNQSVAEANAPEGIAIIGMSGRFPRARDLEEYWDNVRDGRECITFFTDDALLAAGVDPALLADPNYVKAGGVLDDIDLFDAGFFGINPREAEVTDPQQRLFLECVWNALEDAGVAPHTYPGLIGVFAGAGSSTYLRRIYSHPELVALVGNFQVVIGNDAHHLTTLASYKFNLRGPSMAVQTACSSSLVATAMACQSLADYQCDIALAGGVLINVPQTEGRYYRPGGVVSPDGHCRAFDAAAQGTVGGNGVGVVALKRLAEALQDGDPIHAVIRGWAINNDGSLKVGYTAPSVEGQAEVIAMAQAMAGVEPQTITYVEAHGTGTALGDPIEVAALTQAFRAGTPANAFCALGSVKTNIGHLDPAAGVAGLIKTVLALQHRTLPPSVHFRDPNPAIDFANSPFYVPGAARAWPDGPTPRRAGVSSFGIGGTNAHVVLEEAPALRPAAPSRAWQLLVLSARSEAALDVATANLAAHLQREPALSLPDVAFTLQAGRRPFSHRRVLVCADLADAVQALTARDPQRIRSGIVDQTAAAVAFMFTGQGAQYVDMGRDLYLAEPIFRRQIDYCAEYLYPLLSLDLRDLLYPPAAQAAEAAERLRQTAITQPALFAVEYALARLWMAWGVQPTALIGHSIGEYVAACLAGVFAPEEALDVVAARGRLLQQLPAGAMLAVPLPEADVWPLLDDDLALAAVNGPALCVVSGPEHAIDRLAGSLAARGLEGRRVHTSHAFHSAMMDPALAEFTARVGQARLSAPQIPFISNLTGTWITAGQATDPAYWAAHLRRTVRFADGLRELLADPARVLLEVGPGRTLATFARQALPRGNNRKVLSSLRHPGEQQEDTAFLLNTLGQLWLAGVPINWAAVHEGESRRRVSLPTYPFERQRYWVEARPHTSVLAAPADKKTEVAQWLYVPSWRRTPLPDRYEGAEAAGLGGRWLVFADEGGLGRALIGYLTAQGCDVAYAIPGEHFDRVGETGYTVNPGRPADYEALCQELAALGKLPERVVHLWAVTGDAVGFDASQDLGFYSLLYLMQALAAQGNPAPLRLLAGSCEAHAVLGSERVRPPLATLDGLCKVIPQEYPGVFCCRADLECPMPAGTGAAALAEYLAAELASGCPDAVVAYRKGYRWAQCFEPYRPGPRREGLLREGGVYLITGGLGRLGLLLAGDLARRSRATVILTTRSVVPDRATWPAQPAAGDGTGPAAESIPRLQALEAPGSRVVVATADVADAARMQELVDAITAEFGALHGVIHLAGLVDDGSMAEVRSLRPELCEAHFRPKARGLLVLEQVLAGRPLDFCLLFSSLSTALGGPKMAAYAGANAFMDAFAEAQSQGAFPWISVAWDGWQPDGKPGEDSYILPEEGLEVLQRILSVHRITPQVLVSTRDLEARLDRWLRLKTPPVSEAQASPPALPEHDRPDLPNTYVAPATEAERQIADVWQSRLGLAQIGIHDNFFELGGHSLLAIQVASRLREIFDVDLAINAIFEAPTIAGLAEKIESSRRAAREDALKLAEMLEMVEKLSEAEVRELLEGQPMPADGNQDDG